MDPKKVYIPIWNKIDLPCEFLRTILQSADWQRGSTSGHCLNWPYIVFFQPLSILCRSFQDIDTYTIGFPRGDSHGQTNIFRAAKQCFPGPVCLVLLLLIRFLSMQLSFRNLLIVVERLIKKTLNSEFPYWQKLMLAVHFYITSEQGNAKAVHNLRWQCSYELRSSQECRSSDAKWWDL
jgi:hypothetical protein